MFSYIILSPKSTIGLFFIPMPGWIAGVLLIGLSVFLMQRKRKGLHQDHISHESHFWGAIFGVVFTVIIKPDSLFSFINQIF
jgi:membrane associated rhomboid family serine protease